MRLVLPLPPSLNEMIDLAKKRDKQRRSTIYAHSKADYEVLCDSWTRNAGIFPPRAPLPQWDISKVVLHLFNKRDPIELLAGLKWPVDWLVARRFVADDSPRELKAIARPEQFIDRKNQRLEIEIRSAA